MKLPAFLPPSDAALVRSALRDDPRAFERLVLRYQRRAHAVARAVGVPASATDDAVQEAFLKAFRHLPALQAPESFGPWFLEIVRNAARDLAPGSRKRAVEWSEEAEAAGARGFDGTHPIEDEEIKDLLWRKVAELPAPVREAVFLYYHEGESVRAVAKSLGASRSAVLKRLERGRAMLRERLWRKFEDSVRGSVPSEKAWRRKGRQLTILLASAVAGSWGARVAAGTFSGVGAGVGVGAGKASSWTGTILGGMEMSGKKYVLAAALGAVILGGGFLLVRGFPAGSSRELAERLDAPLAPAGDPTRALVPGPAAAVDATRVDSTTEARALVTSLPSLFGRVRGAEGSPLKGARVLAVDALELGALADRTGKLLATERGDLSAPLRAAVKDLRALAVSLPEAKTDAAGEYRIDGLPPGEYGVLASHEEHLPRSDGWAIIRAGQPVRCDIELSAAWRISGRIRDEEGRPVAGGTITSVPSDARRFDEDERKDRVLAAVMEGRLLLDGGRARTGLDGAFSLGSLEPAPHDLAVRKEGFAPTTLHDIPAGKSDVEVVLRRGLSIRGRVLSAEKKPIAGAEVTLGVDSPERPRSSFVGEVVEHTRVPSSMGLDEDAFCTASTDASGRFELTGLAPGSFSLGVSHAGHPALERDIRLEDASIDLEDLLLDRPQAIAGRVLGPGGEPCPGARVWIEARTRNGLPGWGGRASRASVLLETRTGADGVFSLGPLPRGQFALRVSTARFAPAAVRGVAPGGEPIEVRLAEGIGIRGTVVDAEDGSAVEGARIAVGRGLFFDADPEKDVTSGADGVFSVDGIALSEEQVKLSVTHPDYLGQAEEVRLEGRSAHEEVEVKLGRPERISGRVLDGEGNPAAGARVRCEIPGWRAYQFLKALGPGARNALSGPDGSFLLELPRESRSSHWSIEVAASHASLGIGRSTPLVAPDEGKPWPDVEVLLRPGSSLRGRVRNAGGNPIRGALVTARRGSASDATGAYGPSRSAVTNGEGLYEIHGLEPGGHDVEARAQDHAPRLERGLDLGAEPREQDFVLSAGIAIEGRVVDSSGVPAADAEVFAFSTETCDLSSDAKTGHRREDRREKKGGMATARTDGNGRYRLAHLPEEEITLVARAPLSQPSELQVVRSGEPTADLVIVRLSSFAGVVVDAETESPVPWFQVHLRIETERGDRDLIPREFVDPLGAFVIEGVFPGKAVLALRARGYSTRFQEVELEAGAETTVQVRMDRGETLQGTIVDSKTNLPIEYARISCQPRGAGAERAGLTATVSLEWTDASGAFAVPGLTPGKYWVYPYHPGYVYERDGLKVTIAEDGNEPLRIAMIPAGGLEGRIANLEGSKSFDTRLELEPVEGDGGRDHWTRVERDGSFKATSILPGKYRVQLRQQFFKTQMEGGQVILPEDVEEKVTPLGEVEIVAGQTATFEARAP